MDGSRMRNLAALRYAQSTLRGLKKKRNRTAPRRRRRLGAALESLEQRNLLTFAIDLFADINQLGESSNIDQFVSVGSNHFFVADDGLTGSELWTTDGTEAGTVLVKDLLPGPDTSNPENLTAHNGLLFFTADDENGETDLWSSDGTEQGTVKIFDADAAGIYLVSDLTSSGEKLFFTGYNALFSYELWAHDTSTQGDGARIGPQLGVWPARTDRCGRHIVLRQLRKRLRQPRTVEERRNGSGNDDGQRSRHRPGAGQHSRYGGR